MTTTSPGWYDDGHGSMRWWDGANWTEHVGTPGQPDGRPTPSTEPPRSKLWIVWVVLGVIVLGVVITLALLIPIILSTLASVSGSSRTPATAESSAPSPEPSTDPSTDAQARTPSPAEQEAAVASVQRYNDAWLTGDCEAYMATTTEDFRAAMELTNCESFALDSRSFAGGVDGYTTTIGDVEPVGSAVAVSTAESYLSEYDAEGNQTAEALPYEDLFEYIVVRAPDGGWAIDDVYSE